MYQCLNFERITLHKVTFTFFAKSVSSFCHIGWHNKFNNRVDKHHPNVWLLFECLQREELSFRQQLGKLKCGFQKNSDNKPCTTRQQIQQMTKDYEEKQTTLIDFLHGLSTLVAKISKTVA
jgi:hypothetical protein